jgi:hypothetical protein
MIFLFAHSVFSSCVPGRNISDTHRFDRLTVSLITGRGVGEELGWRASEHLGVTSSHQPPNQAPPSPASDPEKDS